MKPRFLAACALLVGCRDAPEGHRLTGPLYTPTPLDACTPAADTYCGAETRSVLDMPHQGFESFYGYASALPATQHPHARVAYTR